MAIVIECDGGCGATTEKPDQFKQFGIIKKVWYCEDCAPELQDLFDARDSIHTSHAGLMKTELLNEINLFKIKLPKAKLPDAKK